MDLERVYPYVIPTGYLEQIDPMQDGFVLPLGHDIHVMLVEDLNGLCRNILPEELDEARINSAKAHKLAIQNLQLVAKGDQIQKTMLKGPNSRPFILWSGHWLSASCITLPDLYDFASKHLKVDKVCVSIPQREAMLIFPFGTSAHRSQMKSMIRKNEADARKPITWELFTLTSKGLQSLIEDE